MVIFLLSPLTSRKIDNYCYLTIRYQGLNLGRCLILSLDIINTKLQSAKILLVPSKYKIILCNQSKFNFLILRQQYWIFLCCSPFSYCSSNLASFLYWFCRLVNVFFSVLLSVVIALPTIATAIVVALLQS